MSRFFMSPYPTFGSYKQPVPFKVESSPYYWWWYALALNVKRGEASTIGSDVLNDFGDMTYAGDRYLAFCNWWRKRVNTLDTRGEFLFAEPKTGQTVALVESEADAREALSDPQYLLLRIPLNMQRRHIDKRLNQILNSKVKPEHGRIIRSVKRSNARYSLSIPVVSASLKKCFDLYDAKQLALENGEAVSNFDLAKRARVRVVEREKDDEINTVANYRRTVSATVSRYISKAESMIESAGTGKFP